MKFFKPLLLPNQVSAALLLLRVIAGLAFMYHGFGKIQQPFCWMGPEAGVPCILQALAAISEFVGGFAWILGLLTPLASIGLACTMLVATFFHIAILHHPFVDAHGGGSYEIALLYLCISILLLLTGPGRFSLDSVIFKKSK